MSGLTSAPSSTVGTTLAEGTSWDSSRCSPALNMTVFETIYGLGNTLLSASSNCAQHNKANQPWRTQHLDDGDDSGGLRKLPSDHLQWGDLLWIFG